jgi:hypothetical protein
MVHGRQKSGFDACSDGDDNVCRIHQPTVGVSKRMSDRVSVRTQAGGHPGVRRSRRRRHHPGRRDQSARHQPHRPLPAGFAHGTRMATAERTGDPGRDGDGGNGLIFFFKTLPVFSFLR